MDRTPDAIRADLGPLADRPAMAAALDLIGQPGSRQAIPTPAALIDLPAFDRNVARMAERARAAGLALRPHAKSHKCAALARRQIAAGAVGVCCAKLGEAEALADAGIDGILITSPIAGALSAKRAAALAARLTDFAMVVDHPATVAELAAAARARNVTIRVLIDADVGLARTGVADDEQALAVARAIAAEATLSLTGVQAYGGQWQHMTGANERAAAVADGMAKLNGRLSALRAAGFSPAILTGGGTGTFATDAAQGVLNEVQPGSYAFMDRQYRDALGHDADGAFEQSLTVAATVISTNAEKWITVDAGLKAFSTEGPMPVPAPGRFEACEYRFFGDEHGRLSRPPFDVRPAERVEFVPPHCDPTIDRYDVLHLVDGDVLVDIVRIEGRGASQ